jgi:hypothetical protein
MNGRRAKLYYQLLLYPASPPGSCRCCSTLLTPPQKLLPHLSALSFFRPCPEWAGILCQDQFLSIPSSSMHEGEERIGRRDHSEVEDVDRRSIRPLETAQAASMSSSEEHRQESRKTAYYYYSRRQILLLCVSCIIAEKRSRSRSQRKEESGYGLRYCRGGSWHNRLDHCKPNPDNNKPFCCNR